MALFIKYKTRLSFTVAVATEGNTCSTNSNQDAKYVGAVGSGGSWNVASTYQRNGLAPTRAVNTYFNDSTFNSSGIWTYGTDWVIDSGTAYGDAAIKTAKIFGVYYKAVCSDGSSSLVERVIPNIDVDIVSQIGNNVTINLSFPAYVNGLTGLNGTFRNLTNGTTLGSVTIANGANINVVENIHLGDIFEYELRIPIAGHPDAYCTCWIEYASDVTPQEINSVTTSTNSFLSFDGGVISDCEDGSCEVCLPMNVVSDLNTQFQIDAESLGYTKAALSTALNNSTNDPTFWVMLCDDCTPPSDTTLGTYHGALNNWDDAGTNNGYISSPIAWQGIATTYFNSLDDKHSFRICLIKRQGDGGGGFENVLLGCSDICFKKVINPCFTTLFQYISTEDSFCFLYSLNPITNVIRLPIIFRNPQMKKTTKGYQKSNGTFVKLSERNSKIFNVEVDNVDERIHDKIAVMLGHDTVTVTNEIFDDENIYCEEDYTINWTEDVVAYNIATASTKAYISKDSCLTNSNC